MQPNYSLTNTVIQLLQQLQVKVTAGTIDSTLKNHPDYPSILSISDALKQWKVDSYTIKVNKEKLHELPTPFIAHVNIQGGSFITITNVTDSHVIYKMRGGGGNLLSKLIPEFLQEWSGVALLAEAGTHAGEENYKHTRRIEILQSLKLPFVISIIFCIAVYSVIFQYYISTIFAPYILLMLLKLAGCTIAVLLLWYEIDKTNPLLKQICSLSKQTNCSAVLGSKQAKLFNAVSWSEIGFFYFAGGLISLLVAGTQAANILTILAWLNVLALPYTFFSIYYQWKVAKQWCVLCLAVQALLVSEFTTSYLSNSLAFRAPHPLFIRDHSVFIIVISFLLPAIAWFLLKPLLLQSQDAKRKKRELLKFKYDQKIFDTLLIKQKRVTAHANGLGISIGNPNAINTIIKVCNPYCGPCAKAHPVIDELIETNKDLQVVILFTADNDERNMLNKPVKHLLAIAEKQNEVLTKQALDDWYLADKKDYDAFAAKYPMNGELKMQNEKINDMREWCKEMEIAFTPTFFINGYQLPDVYNVGDLKYFLSA